MNIQTHREIKQVNAFMIFSSQHHSNRSAGAGACAGAAGASAGAGAAGASAGAGAGAGGDDRAIRFEE